MNKWILVLLFISLKVCSATKTLNITTTIDIANLYPDAISSVVFIPSILELSPTSNKQKFENVSSKLKVSTDIPKDAPAIAYVATLATNKSFCTDFSGVTNVQTDFVDVMFDGLNVSSGDSISIADFDSDDGAHKYSEHDVELIFKPFEYIITTGQPEKCNGEIEFSLEVDI